MILTGLNKSQVNSDLSEEQSNMVKLLSKFRIQFHDLIVVSTADKIPQPST